MARRISLGTRSEFTEAIVDRSGSRGDKRQRYQLSSRSGICGIDRWHEHRDRQLQGPSFPPRIIAHAVWLYYRFPWRLRLVEEMLLERGIVVSYETSRRWGIKFGPHFARPLASQAAQPKRCLAPGRGRHHHRRQETLVVARRRPGWLYARRDRPEPPQHQSGQRLLTRLLKKEGVAPKRMITDKLPSYGAARPGDAERRASVAQGIEQPGGECTCAAAKTGADDAGLPITRSTATLRFDLLGSAQSLRPAPLKTPALATPDIHRLQGMAQWKLWPWLADISARRSQRV